MYHNYKALARGRFYNGSHRNTSMSRPRLHIIQAEANLMTIISSNVDQMPNEFRCISKSRGNNVLVLPCTLNWDNMQLLSNSVMFLPPTPISWFDILHTASRSISSLGSEDGRERNPLKLHPKLVARWLQRECWLLWYLEFYSIARLAIKRLYRNPPSCHKEYVVQERPNEDGREQLLQVHRMRFPTRVHITIAQGVQRMGNLGEWQDNTHQLPKCVPSIVPRLEHEFNPHSHRVSLYYPRQDGPYIDSNS